jgi:hypothetical protein
MRKASTLGDFLNRSRLVNQLGIAFGLALLIAGGGCSESETLGLPDASLGESDAGPAETDGGGTFPETGIGGQGLRISRVAPDHGPFSGGNEATVRGSGFTEEAVVTVGGHMVQPADTELIDAHRLSIVLPAGDPGPADVQVTVGDEQATLEDGYHYDALALDPTRGSVSGGTLLEIEGDGTSFAEGDRVDIGPLQCEQLEVVSATRMNCRTPPGSVGTFDVSYQPAEGDELVVEDGFTYFDSSDPFTGGLGGGPITGTINVTVLNAMNGQPVPDAFAMVGQDPTTEHQGKTNMMGQITFSGSELMGQQTVHIAKDCFEKTSFVSFDASDVTAFLVPLRIPRCAMMGGGGGGGGAGRQGAFIEGELVWPGDFGADGVVPWNNVPDPRDNEEKVAYVFTTQRCPGDSQRCVNPPPSSGNAIQRVLETNVGEEGYPYRIFARPAGLAVYAVAGVENKESGEFTPYIMGVARDVLAGPGEVVSDVDITMNIPLDHTLEVQLEDLPSEVRLGPDTFEVRADIDLGGEGVIVRRFNGEPFDLVTRETAQAPFRLFAQPALLGELSDGRYRIQSRWFTGSFQSTPLTATVKNGVQDISGGVVMDGFLGIPQATAPEHGTTGLPEDRVLRWEADGSEADFHMVQVLGGDGNPAWRHFVAGDVSRAPVPDLSSIPEVNDIASGSVFWVVYAIRIPGFDFDRFNYTHINQRLWSAWAADQFTVNVSQ